MASQGVGRICVRAVKNLLPSRSGLAHNRNVMETTTSFASLAGRLAAKMAEIRPAEGAAVSWANFMALFWCAIFEMLILLCETLDARAAAEAARLAAAPASRHVTRATVPALRAGPQAPSGETRARRLAPEVQDIIPSRAAAPSGTTGRPTRAGPRLVWSRDPGPIRAVHAPPWRPGRETRLFHPPLGTPISLRFRNKIGVGGKGRPLQVDMSHTRFPVLKGRWSCDHPG